MTQFVLCVLTAICAYAGLRKFTKNGKEIDLPTAIYAFLALFFFLLMVTANFNILSVPVTEENPIFQFNSMGGALAVVFIFLSIFVLCIIQGVNKIKKKRMVYIYFHGSRSQLSCMSGILFYLNRYIYCCYFIDLCYT